MNCQGLIPVETFRNLVPDIGVWAREYGCAPVCGGHFGDLWTSEHLY